MHKKFFAENVKEAIGNFLIAVGLVVVIILGSNQGTEQFILVAFGIMAAAFVVAGFPGLIKKDHRTARMKEVDEWINTLRRYCSLIDLEVSCWHMSHLYTDSSPMNGGMRVRVLGSSGFDKVYEIRELRPHNSFINEVLTDMRDYGDYSALPRAKGMKSLLGEQPSLPHEKEYMSGFRKSIDSALGITNVKSNPDPEVPDISNIVVVDEVSVKERCIEYLNQALYGKLKCVYLGDNFITIGYDDISECRYTVDEWSPADMDRIVGLAHSSKRIHVIPEVEEFILVGQLPEGGNEMMGELEVSSFTGSSSKGSSVVNIELTLMERKAESVDQYLSRLEKVKAKFGLSSMVDKRPVFSRRFLDCAWPSEPMKNILGISVGVNQIKPDTCSICGAEVCEHLWYGELKAILREKGFDLPDSMNKTYKCQMFCVSKGKWGQSFVYGSLTPEETAKQVEVSYYFYLANGGKSTAKSLLDLPRDPAPWRSSMTRDRVNKGPSDATLDSILSLAGTPADSKRGLTGTPTLKYEPSSKDWGFSIAKEIQDKVLREMTEHANDAILHSMMYGNIRARCKEDVNAAPKHVGVRGGIMNSIWPANHIHVDLALSEPKRLGTCNSDSKPIVKEKRECLGIATKELLK